MTLTGILATLALSLLATPAFGGGFDADSDWGDEITLSRTGTVHSGNFVGLWQEILSAEFLLAEENVDGQFGVSTENYTKFYQGIYSLTIDGIVGPQTRNVARFMTGTTISSPSCVDCNYDYKGLPFLSLHWHNAPGGTWKWSAQCKAFPTRAPTDHPIPSFTISC